MDIFKDYNWPKFANPPIIQAVLQIRFGMLNEGDLRKIDKIKKHFSADYPIVNDVSENTIEIGSSKISKSSKKLGINCTNEADNSTFSLLGDSFSYISKRNYSGWHGFISEAMRFWKIYSEELNIKEVNVRSLRYIDSIMFPHPLIDVSQFLKTYLFFSDELPTSVSTYYINYALAFSNENIRANIIQTFGQAENDRVPFIFDVDVLNFNKIEVNNNAFWSDFEVLRNVKNNLFFGNLTEKALSNI